MADQYALYRLTNRLVSIRDSGIDRNSAVVVSAEGYPPMSIEMVNVERHVDGDGSTTIWLVVDPSEITAEHHRDLAKLNAANQKIINIAHGMRADEADWDAMTTKQQDALDMIVDLAATLVAHDERLVAEDDPV